MPLIEKQIDCSSTDGWFSCARKIESENFDERPEGVEISLIVIHAISLPPSVFGSNDVIDFFTNVLNPSQHPYFEHIHTLKVSAHFFIRRDGELIQFVSCDKRAWHAGVSSWRGQERCNDFSIGIELEGCDDKAFEGAQYQRLNDLIRTLRKHYPLTDIAGHSDISPGRKTDPGPCFDSKCLIF